MGPDGGTAAQNLRVLLCERYIQTEIASVADAGDGTSGPQIYTSACNCFGVSEVRISTVDAENASYAKSPGLADREIDHLVTTLRGFDLPCEIAFEPTGDYHRPLAYALGQAGFRLCQVSSIAVARTREALYNTWDKNDPKDAQVFLQLLKNGTTQRYLDPLITGYQDLQEMANRYQQVSLRTVRLQHRNVTHVVVRKTRSPQSG